MINLSFKNISVGDMFYSFTSQSKSLIMNSSGHMFNSSSTFLSFIKPEPYVKSKFGKNGYRPITNSLSKSDYPEIEYLTL